MLSMLHPGPWPGDCSKSNIILALQQAFEIPCNECERAKHGNQFWLRLDSSQSPSLHWLDFLIHCEQIIYVAFQFWGVVLPLPFALCLSLFLYLLFLVSAFVPFLILSVCTFFFSVLHLSCPSSSPSCSSWFFLFLFICLLSHYLSSLIIFFFVVFSLLCVVSFPSVLFLFLLLFLLLLLLEILFALGSLSVYLLAWSCYCLPYWTFLNRFFLQLQAHTLSHMLQFWSGEVKISPVKNWWTQKYL